MANSYDSKGIHGAELLVTLKEIAAKIRTDDEVIASALNNLNSRLEAFENIENWGDITADSINTQEFPLVAGDATVLIGTAAPSNAPSFAGQLYVDTTNKVLYVATGYSSSSDWKNMTVASKIGTSTVGSATKPIYLNGGTPAEGSTYAGGTKVTLNGTDKGASTATVYSPTGAGTNGQVLKSTGGTPEWVNQSSLSVGSATTATDYNTSSGTIKSGLDSKVNIANIDLTDQTTTILAQVRAMLAAGTHYARFYTKTDGGSANISDKPESGSKGFLCEVRCNRYLTTSDYRYHLQCWVQFSQNPYTAVVTQETTSISWDRLNKTLSHTHGSITNDGKLGSTADLAVVTGTSGAVTAANLSYTDPTADGTTITAIATVSQDSRGKITATKKTIQSASTSQKGVVQLNDNINSTSTTEAATANAVKKAYDLAATKQDKLTEQTAYTSKGTATKVPQITTNSLGQVTGITEVTISGVTPASHSHGNIQNGGTLQTTDITIANGDKLVITDSSDSNKVARSSLSFDGSTTTTALTPKGTFESFAKAADITSAIGNLDATKTSTDGKNVQVKVTEADGKITAVNVTTDTTANVNDSVYYVVGTTDYPAWAANTAYAVGDNVMYGDRVRTCNTAHTSGSSYDSSKWNNMATPVLKGSITGITALYAGLKIAYKWPCTGGSSSTYLNINNLGNVYIRRNDGNITSHIPQNSVCFMAYDGTYWRWADYNSDSWVTSMGGYCSTGAGTAAKVAESTNTVLTAGMAMLVRFTNTNSAASKLTLNVNSQGAKDLYINGKISSATNYTLPAGEHWCFYDGTNWYVWTDGTVQFKNVKSDKYIGLEYTSGENLAYQYFSAGSSNTSVSSDRKTVTISPENRDTYFGVKFADDIAADEMISVSFDVEYTGDDDGQWAWYFNTIGKVAGGCHFLITGSGHYVASGLAGTAVTRETTGMSTFDDTTRGTLPANSYTIKNIKFERGATATGFCLCPAEQRAAKLTLARKLAVNLANTTTDSIFDGSADQTGIKVSGTLAIGNGGTGQTTASGIVQNTIQSGLSTGSANATDAMEFITTDSNSGYTSDNKQLYRRKAGQYVWPWIKGKLTSDTGVNISGNAATATSATSAGKLSSAKKLAVNLANTSTDSTFDGSADQTGIKVSGKLPIANGGTNATTAADARTNLSVYSKSEVDSMLTGRISIVTALPTTGEAGVIYFVGPSGSGSDKYEEYVWDGSAFVKVGEKSLDLSNYVNTLTTTGSGNAITAISKSGNTITATIGNVTFTQPQLGQGYGTCSTAESTAAKAVTLSDFVLKNGGIVAVKFTYALCASATLDVNSTGAKPIFVRGAAVTSSNCKAVQANDIAYFIYDGTNYHFLGTDRVAVNAITGLSISGKVITYTKANGSTDTLTTQDTTYTQEALGQGYGTCTTAEATAAKEVSLANYALVKNGVIAVKFTYGLCANATLNVNSKGAKSIFIHGAAVTATTAKEVLAGDIALFMYDGTQYQFLCSDRLNKAAITGLSVSGQTVTYTKADGTTGTITTKDTTYSFDGTYDASTNKAATVSTVTNKINALDVSDITGFGAGKTLATLTETDGKIAATFQNISITKSQVSDFPTSMTPTSHASSATTYGVGTTANYGHVKLATGDMNGATDTDGVAVSKNHTHSQYLPKSGGAMTGAITRDLGSGVISDTNLLTVTGSTDGFKVDYGAATSDVGVTKIYTTDDANAKISIGNYNSSYKEAIGITNGSAALSNTPTAPTAAAGTNTTQIATTAFVNTAISGKANKADSVYYVAATFPMDAYSSSKTYSKWESGAYTSANSCVYNNYAYYCNTAITTAEAWNSAHWTRIATPTWNGTIDGVTEITAGLKIAIKLPGYGGSSSTKLNINGLGEKDFRYNTSGYTTHYAPGLVVFAAYNGSYWGIPDYNSDSWVTSMGGYCSTGAGTQQKDVSSSNTVLTAGMAMLVRFTNANTYDGKITMNVNSQGAKDIWINGAVSSSSNKTLPAGEHWCFYDGSKWSIWTNGTVQFKGVHADSYEAKYISNANDAIPPYVTTSSTGGAFADFVAPDSASNIPSTSYNWHIHAIIFRHGTNYRLTQVATASTASAISLTYERNAWSSDGATWTFASSWTEILTSNSTISASKVSGTVGSASKDGNGSTISSTYLKLSGGNMTGTINTPENYVALNFSAASSSYYTTVSYQTSGNEALVFASTSAATSFMFVNGENSVSNHASNRWQSLTPGLQIKNNCVSIGKLIGQNVTPTYKLEVNGTVRGESYNINDACTMQYNSTTEAVDFVFA